MKGKRRSIEEKVRILRKADGVKTVLEDICQNIILHNSLRFSGRFLNFYSVSGYSHYKIKTHN